MRLRAIAMAATLAACGGHATNATPTPTPVAAPIAWTISVAPASVTMAQRASVTVTITATNTTQVARDPERDPLDVTIDGAASMELSMAFGNGGRVRAWSLIPPGHTVIDERNGMQLVDAPGDHVIVIRHAGRELARTTLHVTR